MNLDVIFAIVFYGLLLIFFFTHRSKFEVQGNVFALYKTKLGLKLMDKFAKFSPRFMSVLGVIGIFVGYAGMILMVYFLVWGVFIIFKGGPPLLSPVLPGIQIAPGIPKLGFWHWIISIFIVAAVHEFSHGVYARLYKIKVKSSGFAFLGPILAAFVEPEEKQLEKTSRKAQLSVFAAGPFSNVLLGILFLLITAFILGPISNSVLDFNGLTVSGLEENSGLKEAGAVVGEIILSVNGYEVNGKESLSGSLDGLKPGDNVKVKTDKKEYDVKLKEHPSDKIKPYLGVSLSAKGFKQEYVDKYGLFWINALFWVYLLFWWIYTISIGIGIFNLIPLGPVDGGRMMYTSLTRFMKAETAKKVWNKISLVILLLLFINLLPWIIKLLSFIFKPLL